MIALAHLLFALSLAYLLQFPVVYAVIAAVLPDVDLLFTGAFPFAHRGILHTPVFGAFAMAVLLLATDRREVAAAYGLGHLSHLFLDTLTPAGIAWLYPLTGTAYGLGLAPAHDPVLNGAVIVFSVATVLVWRYGPEVAAWMR